MQLSWQSACVSQQAPSGPFPFFLPLNPDWQTASVGQAETVLVTVTVTVAPPVGTAVVEVAEVTEVAVPEAVETEVDELPVVETLVVETTVEEAFEVELDAFVVVVDDVVLTVVVAAAHLSFLWVFHQAQAPANSALKSSGSSPVQVAIHIPAVAMKLP